MVKELEYHGLKCVGKKIHGINFVLYTLRPLCACVSLVPRPLPDGCEIKSGSGLGTRLCMRVVSCNTICFTQDFTL